MEKITIESTKNQFLNSELDSYDAARELAYYLTEKGDRLEWDEAVAVVDLWEEVFFNG
jgi:hypothetical protein